MWSVSSSGSGGGDVNPPRGSLSHGVTSGQPRGHRHKRSAREKPSSSNLFFLLTLFIAFIDLSRTQLLSCFPFLLPQLPLFIRITSCFAPRFPPASPSFCLLSFSQSIIGFFFISSQCLSPISPSVPTMNLPFLSLSLYSSLAC